MACNLLYLSYMTGTRTRNSANNRLVTAQNTANPERGDGPTLYLAWNEETDAKQHMAINAKKAWRAWNDMAGLEIGS